MEKIKVVIEQELTAENITDLVITALEGGINYWCGKWEVKNVPVEAEGMYSSKKEIIALGGTITLFDAESDDTWDLTLEGMIKGIQMHCTSKGVTPLELMDNYDAGDADCIVQYATMNEVVFG